MEKDNKGWRTLRPVIALTILSFLACGIIYPVVVTGISQAAFPSQANGSQVHVGNRSVGSQFIDNGFTSPVFFHTRNESNPLNASASGVDPDILLADALSQVPRIHAATGISTQDLTTLIESHEERTLWISGDIFVNVLELNIALMNAYPGVYSAYLA